jgi:hypothetical protein
MARKDNRIAVKKTTITLTWPLYGYLDRAIRTGFYGATFTSAAEAAIQKHVEWLIDQNKIREMTEAELANPPEEFTQRPRKSRVKPLPVSET